MWWQANPFRGVQSYDLIPIMQREDPEASPSGAQAATPGTRTLQEVLAEVNLSELSGRELDAFINTLKGPGISKPHFRKFLSYVLKFVEYNRAKYDRLKTELERLHEQALSMREELEQIMTMRQEPLPRVATVPDLPLPVVAPPPNLAPQPTASQATAPLPTATLATAQPSAFQAVAPKLSAFQAVAPPFAPQAAMPGPFVVPTAFSPAILNADGTISRKMDQVGNNVTVTFSGND